MSIKKTDVLGNLVYASVSMACANEIPGYNGTLFAISEETKERIEADLVAARAAVAELIEAAQPALYDMREVRDRCTPLAAVGLDEQVGESIDRLAGALARIVDAVPPNPADPLHGKPFRREPVPGCPQPESDDVEGGA